MVAPLLVTMKEIVKINKLVHGGQGLAILKNGQKVFVWNSLPGEELEIEITKNKKSYSEALVTKVISASIDRIEPEEPEIYLATSPWQMMSFEAENKYKQEIIHETFKRNSIKLPSNNFINVGSAYGYRNKMEYSFFGDENGLHLALYNRGTHFKQIVEGSRLAIPQIDIGARAILDILNQKGIRASNLKSVIVRCTQLGETVAALFVKDENLEKLFGEFLQNGSKKAGIPELWDGKASERIIDILLKINHKVHKECTKNTIFTKSLIFAL